MNIEKYFKIVLCAVVICILIVAGFGLSSYISENPSGLDEKSENGDINVLFMATDKGGLLTDTIMLASVSTENKTLNILSIPRDTKVNIYGRTAKINSAYGVGKEGERIELPKKLIEEITGLEINYYAVVDPEVVVHIVDAVGGVEIDVPERMYYWDPTQNLKIDLQPGLQVLDGDKAEQFLRFRSGYFNADLGRIQAQQAFVKAFIDQKFKLKYITKVKSIYEAVKDNVDTDISVGDIGKFAQIALNFSDYEINTYQLPGIGGNYFTYNSAETDKLVEEVFLHQGNEEVPEE